MGCTFRWEGTRVSQFVLRPQLADSARFVADKEMHRTNILGTLLTRPARGCTRGLQRNTLLARAARNPRTVCGVYFIASAIRNYLPIGASATYAALAPSLPGSGGYHAAHQAKHHRE
jgi:hypothetical protein